MPKYQKKYLKPTLFDPKGHWMVGIEWPVKGSKGNEYLVTLGDRGFECECVWVLVIMGLVSIARRWWPK